MIKFSAPLVPVPFKRAMTNGRQRFNDPRYTSFKDALGFYATLAMHGHPPFEGALFLQADFFKPRPKNICSQSWGDGDNFLKAVLDALQGICYLNDAQVTRGTFSKNIGEAHIDIVLEVEDGT